MIISNTPKIEVFNTDCLQAMRKMEKNQFDLAIVDPPYGMGQQSSNGSGKLKNRKLNAMRTDWDIAPSKEYFNELFRVSKNQIIWGGNYFPFIWKFGGRCFIYWHKGNPVSNFADGELAWTSFDKNAKQFNYRYYGNLEGNTNTGLKFHPTQKPVKLYEWILINYAKPGEKILDTHLGSGSIAIAAHRLNYDLTAFEIDKEYFDSSIKRFKATTAQLRIM